MMLANDDFGVDAEIAGTAKDFDDSAGRRGASAGIAQEFDIDDGAIEFVDVRQDAGHASRNLLSPVKVVRAARGKVLRRE